MSQQANDVVALLRDVGLRRLMVIEGCTCGATFIRGIHIDRSCHKSGGTLRVWNQGGDWLPSELATIAAEALRQFREMEPWANIDVRYCDYEDDNAGYTAGRCVYCRSARTSVDDYLCKKHKADPEVAKLYDFSCVVPHRLQLGEPEPV